MEWLVFKDYLAELTGLSEDALHIYAALFIQVGVAALIRRSLAHLVPWFCVLLILLANEAADLYFPGHPVEPWQVQGGIQDLWNTMLLPTLLLLLARFWPRLVVGRAHMAEGA